MEKPVSIDRCRKLIGTADELSDEQIEEIRAQLYELAGTTVDAFADFSAAAAMFDPTYLSPDTDFEEFLQQAGWDVPDDTCDVADDEEVIQ